jgi:hypothetical protein
MADSPTLVEQFHTGVINQDVNWERRTRDQQLLITQRWLQSQYPDFASIPGTTPQGQALRERFTDEFLTQAAEPTTAEQFQDLAEDWGPALAGGVAAVATKQLPTPLLSRLGGRMGASALASGVGGGAGQVAFEQLRPVTTTLPPSSLATSLEHGAENALMYPLFDLGTQGVVRGLGAFRQRAFAPGATTFATREARAALEPQGATLKLSQLSQDVPLIPGLAEGLGEAGVGGRLFMKAMTTDMEQAVSQLAQQVEEQLVPRLGSLTKLGQRTLKHYNLAHEAKQAIGAGHFAVVDQLSQGGVTVPMSSVLRYMTIGPSSQELARQFEIREIIKEGKPPIPGYAGPRALFEAASSAGPQRTSFTDAQRIRSELLRIGRENEGAADPVQRQAGRQASIMAQELLAQMDKAALRFDPTGKAAASYKFARDFWRDEIAEKFENDLIVRFAKRLETDPSLIATMLRSKSQFDTALAVKNAIPARWETIRHYMIHDIIEDAVKPSAEALGMPGRRTMVGTQPAHIDGKKLLAGFNALGRDYQAFLLEGTTQGDLQRFALALEVAERKAPQFGTVAVLLGQATALAALSATPFGGPSVTPANVMVLAGPTALGYVLSRRSLLRNIADGVLGQNTELVARTVAFANAQAFAQEAKDFLDTQVKAGSLTALPNLPGPRLTQGGSPPSRLPAQPPTPHPPSISTLPDLPERLLKAQPLTPLGADY